MPRSFPPPSEKRLREAVNLAVAKNGPDPLKVGLLYGTLIPGRNGTTPPKTVSDAFTLLSLAYGIPLAVVLHLRVKEWPAEPDVVARLRFYPLRYDIPLPRKEIIDSITALGFIRGLEKSDLVFRPCRGRGLTAPLGRFPPGENTVLIPEYRNHEVVETQLASPEILTAADTATSLVMREANCYEEWTSMRAHARKRWPSITPPNGTHYRFFRPL